jgi:hypothetical protein
MVNYGKQEKIGIVIPVVVGSSPISHPNKYLIPCYHF